MGSTHIQFHKSTKTLRHESRSEKSRFEAKASQIRNATDSTTTKIGAYKNTKILHSIIPPPPKGAFSAALNVIGNDNLRNCVCVCVCVRERERERGRETHTDTEQERMSWRVVRFSEGKRKSLNRYVGFEVLTALVMKSTIFWDITPCSLLSKKPAWKQVASRAIRSSETAVDFQRTTRLYIPEGSIL
jgi:hypothetical protein